MLATIRNNLKRDERGSVTIIFSLSLVAMVLFMGLAIDYSRALAFYDRTQAALDAAALKTTKAMAEAATSDGELKVLAQTFFDDAMKANGAVDAKLDPVKVELNRVTETAALSVTGDVQTVVGKLVGIQSLKKGVAATAVGATKDIELGVMLDVSGSMKGGKIVALKRAAKDMVDILTTANSSTRKARIGLVPYSTSVNLGEFAAKAKGDSGKNGGKGKSQDDDDDGNCVSERKGANAFTDASPASGGLMGSKASNCPDATITPLSDDKTALYAALDDYEADGSTAGHLGIAWAWYMVSSKWQDFWPGENLPKDDDPKKLVKAVVLMTDGMFNTEYEKSANGKSAKQAEKLCAAMHEEGVTVFTVAFDAPDDVLPLFDQCASKREYAFNAKNGPALRKAFARIAQHLNDLRIAN